MCALIFELFFFVNLYPATFFHGKKVNGLFSRKKSVFKCNF